MVEDLMGSFAIEFAFSFKVGRKRPGVRRSWLSFKLRVLPFSEDAFANFLP